METPGCEPDLQKPTFSRSGGRRRGTFAARTPTFYNIKKGDGERRQPGSRILLRTRARVCMCSPCAPPPCGRPTTAPFQTWRAVASNFKQTFAPVCYRQVRKFLKIWSSYCPTSTGRWAAPLSGLPISPPAGQEDHRRAFFSTLWLGERRQSLQLRWSLPSQNSSGVMTPTSSPAIVQTCSCTRPRLLGFGKGSAQAYQGPHGRRHGHSMARAYDTLLQP